LNPADQRVLFGRIVGDGISVREAERMAADLNGGSRASGPAAAASAGGKAAKDRPPELMVMEQRFIDALGTKVAISGGLKSGSIKIDYYSMDDLDRLYSILAGKE
jgi:ParB family chromosome partitioning protein